MAGVGRKTLGLALGGGAARGLAHVGVLSVLDREGIPVDYIAGASAGSLAGAVYAAGLRGERLVDVALRTRWRQIARPTWSRLGLITFARLETFLVRLIGDCRFEDLDIPFATMATDVLTGEPVVLRQGRVAPAVRASSSIPGIVTPVSIDGRLLMDGGVSNNLPISVVRAMGADVVVAIGLTSALGHPPRHFGEIAMAALDYLLAHAGDDPASADLFISLPLPGLLSLLRLSRGAKAFALGQQLAEGALPGIRALLA
jgi:NTE family protein